MLRFDPAGAIDPAYGVTQNQLDELYPRLIELRQELITTDPQPFYRLPNDQLDAYKQHREASELGRIFKVANSQMDVVDAVVVLGSGGFHVGPRSIMDACCDPYHNELRRGPRGGKPRMYFAGNSFDNDSAQALLSRIAASGYGDTDIEQKWTVVVIDQDGLTVQTRAALRHFLLALASNVKGDDDCKYVETLVVPITGLTGKLRDLAAIGCKEIFNVPEGVADRFSVLSAVGMIPAAMLGLDINKLLAGAVAMNEHFENTLPQKNIVLQYVAVNHLLEKHRGITIRVLSVCTEALETFGNWYDQLLTATIGSHASSSTPLTIVNAGGFSHCRQQLLPGRSDKVFNHLILERFRTDRLSIAPSDVNEDSPHDVAGKDFTSIMSESIRKQNNALHEHGSPTTEIILPVLDTFILGQLFQMLMIATAIEARLLEIDSPSF